MIHSANSFDLVANPSRDMIRKAWDMGSASQKRAVLWDQDYPDRRETFIKLVIGAPNSFALMDGARPTAISWCYPLRPGSLSGQLHFYNNGLRNALDYLAERVCTAYLAVYKNIAALVPGRWFGAIDLLKQNHFTLRYTMRKAGMANGHKCDLLLYARERGDKQ